MHAKRSDGRPWEGELKRTIKEMPLQTLRKSHMRRSQRLLQLRKPITVILTLQVTLDTLQRLLHSLHTGVKVVDLAEEVVVAVIRLGVLVGDIADDVVACVIDQL